MTSRAKTAACLGFVLSFLASSAAANEAVRICLSAGSEADGVTAMIHNRDDSSVRVDSPYSDSPNSRITRWSEDGYFDRFWGAVAPAFADMDGLTPDACDDAWRDMLVVTFEDGTSVRQEASCTRNPIHQLRNSLAMTMPSLVENASREETEGALEGVYDPCARDW